MEEKPDRAILADTLVLADLTRVWHAWTTEAGVRTFFAPGCRIDLRPGGAYEMYFSPESPPGQRGGEGCQLLAVQPEKMLSFTWNNPPSLPEVRGQFTHVLIWFWADRESATRVTLVHDGWGMGCEWDRAFAYFAKAWKRVVLPRLAYRFEYGPVDWDAPPDFSQGQ